MFLDYNFRNYNYRLFLYVLLLNITGVLIIRSASNQDASMVMKQIVGILVGLTAVVILSLVDYHRVVSFAPVIYGASLAFLLAVLVFGVSRGVARRWLVLPVIGQIQPSEFVKISFVFFVASSFKQSMAFKDIVVTTALAAFHVLIISGCVRPDLFTAKPVHQSGDHGNLSLHAVCGRFELPMDPGSSGSGGSLWSTVYLSAPVQHGTVPERLSGAPYHGIH